MHHSKARSLKRESRDQFIDEAAGCRAECISDKARRFWSYRWAPTPQHVFTTIWSLQSSSETTMFIAGRQRAGRVWRCVQPSFVQWCWHCRIVTGFPLSWLKKFPGLLQDPRSIFPGPCHMPVMFKWSIKCIITANFTHYRTTSRSAQ